MSSIILSEAGISPVKLNEIITILDNDDVIEDEDGYRYKWIKAATDIVPLRSAKEDFSACMSLTKDQISAVYDLFDDAIVKAEDY